MNGCYILTLKSEKSFGNVISLNVIIIAVKEAVKLIIAKVKSNGMNHSCPNCDKDIFAIVDREPDVAKVKCTNCGTVSDAPAPYEFEQHSE